MSPDDITKQLKGIRCPQPTTIYDKTTNGQVREGVVSCPDGIAQTIIQHENRKQEQESPNEPPEEEDNTNNIVNQT